MPVKAKAALLLAAVAALYGCSSRGGPSTPPEELLTLKPIARFYGNYFQTHQGNPPPDEAAFKAFLKESQNADLLKAEHKVTDIDKMFISPRDNQPYVIFYGRIPNSSGPGGAPVVAYEKKGREGKRYIASAVGAIEEVDEAAFRKLVPDAK